MRNPFLFRTVWVLFSLFHLDVAAQIRQQVSLNEHWRTIADDQYTNDRDFALATFNDAAWKKVEVPHNWDGYEGYRRLKHGNRHGAAWYRKQFVVPNAQPGKRYFIFFEGVGSYATVWLNGKKVGSHKGGRTTFTIDVTEAIRLSGPNLLAVKADHPEMITDLPWVCGGCSNDRGWSEGSQPLGIFRPVHLIATSPVRIEPFGVHVWSDERTNEQSALLHINTELKNYGNATRLQQLVHTLVDRTGATIFEVKKEVSLSAGALQQVQVQAPEIINPHLWSLEDPYLYKLVTEVYASGKRVDSLHTPYGIRWISWPVGKQGTSNQFFLNGKPVFINGTCEYEHMMGKSHAFDAEQINARVAQIKAAGFNAFRDAHQPHNLHYQQHWDEKGVLWWPQFSAHVWYDTPEFKETFKQLIVEWVKERRNSPSNVLWGLQNESKLSEAFSRECTELIRKLDPTAATQRLVTTCNGGSGTDWDVPQNWTGTYGGNPAAYGSDLLRQILVGEYGAWRTLGLHAEGGLQQNGVNSEERMTRLMEWKVQQAEAVRDSVAGHFHWLFNSHENPGRVQAGEGFRETDRIGPVNYKGLLTPWGEPTDAFYMYRANYAPKATEPMVYIASHTWPGRWITPGVKTGITVYSNCDEVELFNDVRSSSLGRRSRRGVGTHFQWDSVLIRYNVLYAEGRVGGKVVARDTIVLHHLPEVPGAALLNPKATALLQPSAGLNYLYRVNCGGPAYTDALGQQWMADRAWRNRQTWGSLSWTAQFAGMSPYYASQRTTNAPIGGTSDDPLFQSFRYGQDQLEYRFPLADGNYQLELFFTEPWYGVGGGIDATGWRVFDIAVNDKIVLRNFDIWKEGGSHNHAVKKIIPVQVRGGMLRLHFPRARAGQALIAAIAIASANKALKPAAAAPSVIGALKPLNPSAAKWQLQSWLQAGDQVYADKAICFAGLPAELYGAEWIQTSSRIGAAGAIASFVLADSADVYVGIVAAAKLPTWLKQYEDLHQQITTGAQDYSYRLYRRRYPAGSKIVLDAMEGAQAGATDLPLVFVLPATSMEPPYDLKPTQKYEAEAARLHGVAIAPDKWKDKVYVHFPAGAAASLAWQFQVGVADKYALRIRYINQTGKPVAMKLQLHATDGTLMYEEMVSFPVTPDKWALLDTSTGSMINAGTYRLTLMTVGEKGLGVDLLEVQ